MIEYSDGILQELSRHWWDVFVWSESCGDIEAAEDALARHRAYQEEVGRRQEELAAQFAASGMSLGHLLNRRR